MEDVCCVHVQAQNEHTRRLKRWKDQASSCEPPLPMEPGFSYSRRDPKSKFLSFLEKEASYEKISFNVYIFDRNYNGLKRFCGMLL